MPAWPGRRPCIVPDRAHGARWPSQNAKPCSVFCAQGKGPPEIGANGHSRDGKPRNPQVLVGLVMVDGWPIAHHVFAGNRRDAMTVSDVVIDLEQRFGLKRIVFVGDRGMVTSQNLDDLRGGGHGYIVGRNRRRSGEVFDYIQSATGPFIECPVGITAREKSPPPKTLVRTSLFQNCKALISLSFIESEGSVTGYDPG